MIRTIAAVACLIAAAPAVAQWTSDNEEAQCVMDVILATGLLYEAYGQPSPGTAEYRHLKSEVERAISDQLDLCGRNAKVMWRVGMGQVGETENARFLRSISIR